MNKMSEPETCPSFVTGGITYAEYHRKDASYVAIGGKSNG
jgi:hypothetical protein